MKLIRSILWRCLYAPTALVLCTLIILIAIPYIIADVVYEKWLAWKKYMPVNLAIFKEGFITQRRKKEK